MAGKKERYKVQYSNGTIRTVVAQSYLGAKRVFIARFQPPKGQCIRVWPQGQPGAKKDMRT